MKSMNPVLVALIILLTAPLTSAQSLNRSENPKPRFRFQPGLISPFALNRAPLFSSPSVSFGSKTSGSPPLFPRWPSLTHSFLFQSQNRRFNLLSPANRYPFFSYGGHGYNWGPAESQSSGLESFIDQWGKQDPFTSGREAGISDSSLLSPGMTEEEVTRILGSPISKISSGMIQIWKYSGFSLRFEDYKLKGLQ